MPKIPKREWNEITGGNSMIEILEKEWFDVYADIRYEGVRQIFDSICDCTSAVAWCQVYKSVYPSSQPHCVIDKEIISNSSLWRKDND